MRLFSQIIRACFVILVLTASRCSLNDHGVDKDVRLALEELDATLQKSGEFISAKEARIDSLRRSSGLSSPGEEQYHLYDAIFDEYLKWNCDSAMTYAHKKEALAASLGLPILINDAAEDLARRYILSGMYHHAMDILSRGDAKTGSAYSTNPTRTILLYEIYHGIVLASADVWVLVIHPVDETLVIVFLAIPHSVLYIPIQEADSTAFVLFASHQRTGCEQQKEQ